MARLPLLRTGAPAQYPCTRTLEARCRVLQFTDGTEQRLPVFTQVRKKWRINLSLLSDYEAAAISSFIDQQEGRKTVLEFEDPIDGTLSTRCRFESNNHELSVEGIDRTATDLVVVEEAEV
jgi:hypothetical protein